MTDFSHIEKRIEWLTKESHRNSRMQGDKRDDGTYIHSVNRRRTLRGRAYQQKQAATTMRQMLDENKRLRALLACGNYDDPDWQKAVDKELEASDE